MPNNRGVLDHLSAGWLLFLIAAIVFVLAGRPSLAQELVVGTKEAPPFAMQRENGEWEGLSIDIWRGIAEDLNVGFHLQEASLQVLLDGVSAGRFDAVVGAITVTSEREQQMDFSHPFYSTGWSIVLSEHMVESPAMGVIRRLVSVQFLYALGALAGVLLVAGALVWAVERRANGDQFGGSPVKGLGNGFWWAAVTMTTVGYGDKAPVTAVGRFIGLIWMFASIIIISGFTAAIASSLTVGRLESQISGLGDLDRLQTGVVRESASETYLNERGIRSIAFDDIDAVMDAMRQGRIDAMFHDTPLLAYLVEHTDERFGALIPRTFGRQDYAIALPEGDARRESINQAVLAYIDSSAREEAERRYLGNPEMAE